MSYTNIRNVTRVYAAGDSLTARGYYESKLQTLLGSAWSVVNYGVGGNTTAQVVSRFAGEVLSPGDARYVIIFAGINDVIQGVSTAIIQNNLQSLYDSAHNSNAVVVAITLTPFKGNVNWDSGRQTVLEAVNAWIKTSATNLDFVIDAYTLMEDPIAAATLLPAYDSGDHLHFNQVGGDELGNSIFANVNWTPSTDTHDVSLSKSTTINQNLATSSRVRFNQLTLDSTSVDRPALILIPGYPSLAPVPGAIESLGASIAYTGDDSIRRKLVQQESSEFLFIRETNNVPASGRGLLLTYGLAADTARLVSYIAGTSTLKPLIIEADPITLAAITELRLYAPAWKNVYWAGGVMAVDGSGNISPTNNPTVTGDVEAAAVGKGFILKSPNGSRWKITVDNSGTIGATAL